MCTLCTVPHPSQAELETSLAQLAETYPDLVHQYQLGCSVEGRTIPAVRLATATPRPLLTPMLKFVANMHGDETLGRQMLLYLAEYLALHYENDEVRHTQ